MTDKTKEILKVFNTFMAEKDLIPDNSERKYDPWHDEVPLVGSQYNELYVKIQDILEKENTKGKVAMK